MAEAISTQLRSTIGRAHPIEQIILVPSGKGIFDVEADGRKIFSKYEIKRHAEHGEVIASIRSLLG